MRLAATLCLLTAAAAACSSGKSAPSTVRSAAADAAVAQLPPVAVPDAAVAVVPPVVAKGEPRIVVSTCFPLGALAKTPLTDEQQSLAPHYDPGRWTGAAARPAAGHGGSGTIDKPRVHESQGAGFGTGDSGAMGCCRRDPDGRREVVMKLGKARVTAPADAQVDAAVIDRYLRRFGSRFEYCYAKQLLADPELRGVVKLTFQLNLGNGTVGEAEASGVNADVAACVASSVKQLQLPKLAEDGVAQVAASIVYDTKLGGGGTGDGRLGGRGQPPRPSSRIVPVSSEYAHATVRTFLAGNEAALTACYPADSQLAGEALVSVVVTADGLVKQAATLGLADAGIEQCLTAAVQGLKLPAPGKLSAFGCRLTVGRSMPPRSAPPTLRLRLGGDLAETHGELKRARLDLELSDGPADARAALAGRAVLQVDAGIESGAVASMIRSALVAGYTRVVLAASDDGGTTWHPVVEIVTAPELAVAPRGAPIVLVGQDGVQLAALGTTEKPRLLPVAELAAALAALGPAKPLQVAGAPNVPFSTLAIALRAVVSAGFTDVTLVPATRLAFQFAP